MYTAEQPVLAELQKKEAVSIGFPGSGRVNKGGWPSLLIFSYIDSIPSLQGLHDLRLTCLLSQLRSFLPFPPSIPSTHSSPSSFLCYNRYSQDFKTSDHRRDLHIGAIRTRRYAATPSTVFRERWGFIANRLDAISNFSSHLILPTFHLHIPRLSSGTTSSTITSKPPRGSHQSSDPEHDFENSFSEAREASLLTQE